MQQAIDFGILTINEVRAFYGRPSIAGGDVLTIRTPTGIVAVSDLVKYFE